MTSVAVRAPRLLRAAFCVGITALLLAELVERIAGVRRQATLRLRNSWTDLERQERHRARRTEIAALAGQLARTNPTR